MPAKELEEIVLKSPAAKQPVGWVGHRGCSHEVDRQPTSAMQSISTRTSRGSLAASTVDRAGGFSEKCRA